MTSSPRPVRTALSMKRPNPARLHTAANPDFYKGTVVEDAVAKELARC